MWVLWLKCLYQTLQIRSSILFYKIVSNKCNQADLVNRRLQSKEFQILPEKGTKVFAIFSVSNWEMVLLEPLASLGELYHFQWPNVKSFFTDKESWISYRDQLNKRLVVEFDHFYEEDKNMVVFLYASDFSISEASMRYMNRKNVLVVSFCWDDLLYFKGEVTGQKVGIHDLSKYADINLTFSPESIFRYNYYQSPAFFWGSKEIPLQNALTIKEQNKETSFYVVFIGSNYGWRTVFITNLRKAGIDVKCFGSGWENEPLTVGQMKDVILNAPLTLGFANIGYTKNVTTIKGRDFEVPLYGGLYLTQYSKGLVNYFEPNQEVYTYHDFEDCLKKIHWIKDQPEKANRVRIAGHAKAIRFGSWISRISFLKELIRENCTNG